MHSDYQNWEKILISEDRNIKNAIELIEKNIKENLLNILLVVDEEKKLLGTLTDGDIRRGLINHSSIETKVTSVMCANPTCLNTEMEDKIIKQIVSKNHRLRFFPLINNSKTLVGLRITEIYEGMAPKAYTNPVFIVAGGFGSRLKPLTDAIPKPLIKVGDKPILEHIIVDLVEHGFSTFYISVHYKYDLIMDYFGDGSDWGIDINYIIEDAPLGTAGSLSLLPRMEIKEPMLMMNADLLTKVDFHTLMQFHQNRDNKITVCVREHEVQVPYGVFETDGQHVLTISEKPTFQYFVNGGIYVVNPEILDSVDKDQFIDMTTVLKEEIDSGSKVNLFHIFEYWRDIGGIADLKKTRTELSVDKEK